MVCSVIQLGLSILIVKHLVTGQRQKAPNFSAFHWSPCKVCETLICKLVYLFNVFGEHGRYMAT